MVKYIFISLLFCITFLKCASVNQDNQKISTGAENFEDYISIIKGKNVAVVANHTSQVNGTHLVDTLLSLKTNIVKIFSPEHGFRGTADAGAYVDNNIDKATGLHVVSLYGNNRKPNKEQLKGVDIVLFDLQDVGVRFFTYMSTLHYVMEACAENNIPLIILDRPNPNGFYVDGPILEMEYKSFVGMYPIPVVHGMTLAELSLMSLGEGWCCENDSLNIRVVKCKNYSHKDFYKLQVKPSPNLPNMNSVYLYPSICLFEGTVVSEGRGTLHPFQLYGHPDFVNFDTIFTPVSIKGASTNPKFKNVQCKGYDLSKISEEKARQFNLSYLIDAYNQFEKKDKFFISYFSLLAGTNALKEQIIAGKSEKEIRDTWQNDLTEFKKIRNKYLLYPDFILE